MLNPWGIRARKVVIAVRKIHVMTMTNQKNLKKAANSILLFPKSSIIIISTAFFNISL